MGLLHHRHRRRTVCAKPLGCVNAHMDCINGLSKTAHRCMLVRLSQRTHLRDSGPEDLI